MYHRVQAAPLNGPREYIYVESQQNSFWFFFYNLIFRNGYVVFAFLSSQKLHFWSEIDVYSALVKQNLFIQTVITHVLVNLTKRLEMILLLVV